MAKLCHFGKIRKAFGNISMDYLEIVFGIILNLLWPVFYAVGQFFTVVSIWPNIEKLRCHPVTLSYLCKIWPKNALLQEDDI